MPSDTQVAAAEAIQRRTGKTFYLATRFLPRRVRRATHVLYGFFRVADEVVDGPERDGPDAQRARLAELREAVLGPGVPDDPVLAAFREVRRDGDIPASEVAVFLDAMATDVDRRRYPTYEDLEAYMRGSAVSVAHMMLAVMGPADPETARPHAAALGEAFQLTNFLRDVREDVVERDRVYLPLDSLAAHGVTEAQVRDLRPDADFRSAMRAELARAEARYREGVAGVRHLPDDCQFPVLLAAVLYADHHRLVRKRDYDVLTATPSLSLPRKLSLVARTYYHWRRSRDPETAFHAVTGVSPYESDARPGATGHPGPAP